MIQNEHTYDANPRLKALISAAVHAYARLQLDQITGDDHSVASLPHAWKHFGDQIHRSSGELQNWRVGMDDEAIKAFAIVAVRDGYMNHVWLEEWLTEANYSEAEKLLSELFPERRPAFKKPVINLPALTGSISDQALANLSTAIQRQASVVALIGADGMGKSQVLKGFAWHCHDTKPFRFERILYFNSPLQDWQRLEDVLTTLLIHLGNGVIDWSIKEKRDEVERLLGAHAFLLLLDAVDVNAEDALFDWLQHIPAPSKVVIASKKDLPKLQECAVVCRLNPLNPRDYSYQYRAFLDELLRDFPDFPPLEINRLLIAVEGNPLAMEMILGHSRSQSENAQLPSGTISDQPFELADVVRQNCAALSSDARRLLFALIPFPEFAYLEPIMRVAGEFASADQFRAALDELVRLRLIKPIYVDRQQIMAITWSSVTREQAKLMVSNQGIIQSQIFERWINYYANLAESVGYCPFEPERLSALDREFDTLKLVLTYVDSHQGHEEEAIRLASCTYFYFVRGHWATNQSPHRIAMEAASRLGRADDELYHLAFEVEWLTKRANFDHIHRLGYLQRMEILANRAEVTTRTRVIYLNTLAYYLCENNTDRVRAIELLKESIHLGQQIDTPHRFIASYRLALCYSKLDGYYLDARRCLEQSIQDCLTAGDERTTASMRLLLALLILQQSEHDLLNPEDRNLVENLLGLIKPVVNAINDHNQNARLLEAEGRFFARIGRMSTAREQLKASIRAYRQLARKANVSEVEQLLIKLSA